MLKKLLCFLIASGAASAVFAQGFASLKTISPPPISGLDRYVRDDRTLVVLGKALFWDMQVGSDGRTACGTCHFHAGADHRDRSQFSNPLADVDTNHTLSPDDFPFRVFADPADNRSPILRDSGQRVGSAGVTDPGGLRRVTPRNTPTVINVAFHVRGFRDGRASDIFTGLTPFGDSDPRANVIAATSSGLVPEKVRLPNSSLASQATAPPLNIIEMAHDGRTWPMVGRSLLPARPLAKQKIAPDDSVLAAYADPDRGFSPPHTYLTLVQTAFQPTYWDTAERVGEDQTLAEYNFPLFFALAVQAYESTLIADDTPFDRFLAGNANALTPQQKSGFYSYQGVGSCQFCHNGPELTNATYTFTAAHGSTDVVLTGPIQNLHELLTDSGFFNTGVRPAIEDQGLDTVDDFNMPVSVTAKRGDGPLGIAAAFKVPGLRNVEFTGPYFHNGGQATLEQVIDFYARGGDFPDTPGLPAEIVGVSFPANERADLVAFLKALTDDRVKFERAPFDHPELCVPVGDRWVAIAAVGRSGNNVPLQTFDELLNGIGADGARAHNLKEVCTIFAP